MLLVSWLTTSLSSYPSVHASKKYLLIKTKTGFVIKKQNLILDLETGFFSGRTLRVARPTGNAMLFFANAELCVRKLCGLDVELIAFVARKMNTNVR